MRLRYNIIPAGSFLIVYITTIFCLGVSGVATSSSSSLPMLLARLKPPASSCSRFFLREYRANSKAAITISAARTPMTMNVLELLLLEDVLSDVPEDEAESLLPAVVEPASLPEFVALTEPASELVDASMLVLPEEEAERDTRDRHKSIRGVEQCDVGLTRRSDLALVASVAVQTRARAVYAGAMGAAVPSTCNARGIHNGLTRRAVPSRITRA